MSEIQPDQDHLVLVPQTRPVPDRVADLVPLLEQLARGPLDPSTVMGAGRDLGPVPWTEQDPDVLQLLSDVARSYLDLAAEHQSSEDARRTLEHLATHDVLTGLPNRALVLDRIEHALEVAARSDACLAVLYIDVDGFKEVNDTLGHAAGDIVLKEVADRLRRVARSGDTVGRMSGDEFVVVCEQMTGSPAEVSAALDALAQRLSDELSLPSQDCGHEVALSASIGAAIASAPPPQGPAHLLHEADEAMYVAKRAGGGRFVISESHRGMRLVPPEGESQQAALQLGVDDRGRHHRRSSAPAPGERFGR